MIVLAYALTEIQGLADANGAKQDEERLVADSASQAEADTHREAADKHIEEADSHFSNAAAGLTVGLTLAVVAAWILLDPPAEPSAVSLQPFIVPGKEVALALRWRW